LSEQTGAGGEESVSGELGERVRALVAAAEGMAAAVRGDADTYAERRRQEADSEAERRLSEASEQAEALLAERVARISELSDDILEQAEAVSRALRDAAESLSREGTAERRPPTADESDEHPMADQVRPLRPPTERPPRSLRTVAPAHVPRSDDETRLDDARLVALQMAVAGRTRDEVGAHLRTAFDVPDPDPILDHVFAEGFPPRPPTGA
jgi:vacuolar-type H+-ATPase subunit H